jgi:site-specific recombinase XerD
MDRAGMSPLLRSFERHLRALNRSDNTIESYLEGARQAERFLTTRGRILTDARRGGLEAFLADLLARRSASTGATRHKVLRILYRWLEEEDEVEQNPMARVKPPIVPEEGLQRLLAACAGKTFDARRDTAIVMFLLDTGARRAELAGLRVADLDLDVALVPGKGRRERALPFGRNTAVALDRYLRVRARHKLTGLPWLWLGRAGPLTAYGVLQILRRRGAQAGLPGLHAHQLRHTFAHAWLAQGGGETDLMRLAGWKSRAMLGRYGASAPIPAPARPIVGSPQATGYERDRILIRVLPQGLFPQDRACNLRERPTAGDRWRPLRTARVRWHVDQTWTADRSCKAR